MKTTHYLLLSFISVALMACTGNMEKTYEPLKGYNGKIKKLVTYEYESDIEKSRIISKYGAPIPKSVQEYNKYGKLERSINIELPTQEGEDLLCTIEVDSISYNKQQQQDCSVKYIILVRPDEVSAYNEPEKLIQSNTTLVIKSISKTEFKADDNRTTEITRTDLSYDDKKSGNIVQSLCCDSKTYNEIVRLYDKGLLMSESDISRYRFINHSDTNTTEYKYKNDLLWEKRGKSSLYRYDEKGRVIYEKAGQFETISTYKDTSVISTSSIKNGEDANSATLEIWDKDSLSLFSVYINLDDRKYYVDDAILLLEKYRDEELSQGELIDEIEKIVSKVDDSFMNRITIVNYENYDAFNNPLKIVEKIITISNKAAFMPSAYRYLYSGRGVDKSESKDITEKEIEYYE